MIIVVKLRNFLLAKWARVGRIVFRDHYIFVHKDESKLQFLKQEGERIHIFDAFEELPENILFKIRETFGPNYDETVRTLFLEKARLYVLMMDEELGSIGWIQLGKNLSRWWMEIDQNDFVMFSAITNPRLRGQHLWGRILATAYQQEHKNGGRYYADCNVANIPSRRQLERAGFEIIGRENSLKMFKR